MLTNSYGLSLSGDGITLPDLGGSGPTTYNLPPQTGGSGGWAGGIQTGIDLLGKAAGAAGQVLAVVDKAKGANTSQPVTLPAPNSPVGNNDTEPEKVSIFASWPQRIASKFGIAVGVVWAVLAALGLFVLWAGFRILKRVF